MLAQKNETNNPTVKYEFYRKYFADNFKISFGRPKSDTCQKCDKLINKISAADSEARLALEQQKSIHLRMSETFYSDLKTFTQLSNDDPTKEVLTFDYQQNMPFCLFQRGCILQNTTLAFQLLCTRWKYKEKLLLCL